jgi:hypothetical protein
MSLLENLMALQQAVEDAAGKALAVKKQIESETIEDLDDEEVGCVVAIDEALHTLRSTIKEVL